MIAYLQPLRGRIWRRAAGFSIVAGGVSFAVYYVLLNVLELDTLIAASSAIGSLLFLSLLLQFITANQAIRTTDYLARAIILATDKPKDIDRPAETELPRQSREFLSKLAERIMDMSTAMQTEDQVEQTVLQIYQTLVNVLLVLVIVVDRDEQITYANEAAIKYVEKSPEDVIGHYIYDVCNLSFVSETTLEAWLKTCREGAVVENEYWERVRLTLDNSHRKQFDLAAHYRKDDVTGIELALVFFDRTIQYERDDHDLSFVSLAVHELRTPLTIMRGYIEVFADELSPQLNNEQATFMHNMTASAQQLSAFVSNILNVARIEENALYLRLKEEDWGQTLTQACTDMQLRAQVHDKRLVVEIDQNLPTVAADKVSMFEVINNLIDNAIKYTHTTEDITVRSYVKNGMVETTVTDKGVGIPSSLLAHVFDKFYRAHGSKNSVGGTGLGLYLCKAIVDAHGGTIWVQSKEGEGSTFGFTLPIYTDVADEIGDDDNKEIIRGAHGWIKNHSLYRG